MRVFVCIRGREGDNYEDWRCHRKPQNLCPPLSRCHTSLHVRNVRGHSQWTGLKAQKVRTLCFSEMGVYLDTTEIPCSPDTHTSIASAIIVGQDLPQYHQPSAYRQQRFESMIEVIKRPHRHLCQTCL